MAAPATPARDYATRKRDDAEQRRRDRSRRALQDRIADLETRIAEAERGIKELEARLADPTVYGQPDAAKPVIDEHQSLMWTVGELLSQWEMLTGELEQNRM